VECVNWLIALYVDEADWLCCDELDEDEPESSASAKSADDRLCASSSALVLPDAVWLLPNPPAAEPEDRAAALSSASARIEAKPDDWDDDDGCGDVKDWMASTAAEAAPMAGNMAQAPNGRVTPSGIGQQAPCHGKKANEMIVFAVR
jgi:hypothetical protein